MPSALDLRSKLNRLRKKMYRLQPRDKPPSHSTTATTTHHKTYEYQPLDKKSQEIRLLRLLPGEFDDPIHLEVFHAPLVAPEPAPDTRRSMNEILQTMPDGWSLHQTVEGRYIFQNTKDRSTQWVHPKPDVEKSWYHCDAVLDPYPGFEPVFEACFLHKVSYTWGNQEATEEAIIVSAGSKDHLGSTTRILQIRPNLHQALQHLRQSSTDRTLWIDALCINQSDISERNHEVKRMESIYRLAHRVIVWLGPAPPDQSSKRALEILHELGEQTEYTRDYWVMPSPTAKAALWDREVPLALSEQELMAVRDVLERPWWERLWIWQEVHLASPLSILQCGSCSITWYHLRRALQNIHLRDELESGLPYSLRSSRAFFSRNQLHDLETMLERTSATKFSVSHDRIFALFGFLDSALVARINVDYAQPVGHLFRDVCRAWNANNDELYFLDFCEPREECAEETDWPSWVPNWLGGSDLEGFRPGFAAGTAGSGSVTFTKSELFVYGVDCGTVEAVSTSAPLQGSIKPVLQMWKQLAKSSATNGTRSEYPEDFIATLQCGETQVMFPGIPAFPSLQDCVKSFYQEDVEPLISNRIRGRSFFRSSTNHYGICPPGTKAGDVVCVLLGLDYPIMLRPSTNSDGGYRVLGLTYVHGLMNAEALLGSLPSGWQGHYDDDWEGVPLQAFTDPQTGKVIYDDPRLGSLPKEWQFEAEYDPGAPAIRWLKHKKTGTRTRRDPRLLPDALQNRGTPVKELRLV